MGQRQGRLNNQIHAWQEPALDSALFLHADYRFQTFERHFHSEYAIGVMQSGCQAFVYDDRTKMDMPGGTVALISPGLVHSGTTGCDDGWRYRMLYPSKAIVDQALFDVFQRRVDVSFNAPVVQDTDLYAQLEMLHAASEAGRSKLEIETLFLGILRLAFERHAGTRLVDVGFGPHRPGLRRAQDFLHAHYERALSLDELSSVAGLSKFEFARQFKQAFGLPPHAYLKQLRTVKAREFILAGKPLAEGAATSGFADQAHMTRSFRSILGYTPGQLAQSAI